MALALYRKYRPRTFAEIIGQEHVTEPLSQALRSGRLHHAYLFSGPRGCGKTSSARILARSLNCEKGPTPDPCGECDSCRALAPDGSGSIDVIEIDAASHGGVDDARDLRERAFFAPIASRFKVYVIDEAHMVSSAGFNALLKLVEEPPEYVKFVFATTEPEKVLGTIKSRTHHYPFRLIPPGVLRPYLEMLCKSEGVSVEPAVLPLVVRAGGGSARDSLSVLDQLIAGAGPGGVTYARAVALLGVTDGALLDEMCDALAAGDGAAAYATIDRVAEAGHDPRRFASDLLERLRDLIILQQVPDAVAKGLLDCPQDVVERMASQASHLGTATLSRFADLVANGLTEMRGTTAPRLLLELICARMLLPAADGSAGALLQRLERMERRLELGASSTAAALGQAAVGPGSATAAPVPAGSATAGPPPTSGPSAVLPEPPPAASAPSAAVQPSAAPAAVQPSAAPAATAQLPDFPQEASGPVAVAAEPPSLPGAPGALDAVAVRRVWDEVLTIVGRKSKRAAAVVREATVRDVDGGTLVLVFRHSVHADMLSGSPDLLVEALYELLGGRWQLRCEVGGATTGTVSAQRRDTVPARREPPARPGPAAQTDPARLDQSLGTRIAADPSEAQGSDWPTPAVPGGGATPPPRAGRSSTAAASRQAPAPRTAPDRPGRASDRAGRPSDRAGGASDRPGRAPDRSGRGSDRRTGNENAWDSAAADEPPYDPEYDPAVPGFDPGDEPEDDAQGGSVVRESSEEQALRLLSEALGAERIGDNDGR